MEIYEVGLLVGQEKMDRKLMFEWTIAFLQRKVILYIVASGHFRKNA